MLEFSIIKQKISVEEITFMASDSQNYITAKFTFDDDWDNLVKTAIFYQNEENVYHVVLDSENSCIVPHEALADSGYIYIGVFGVSGTKRITTNIVNVAVDEGSYGEGLIPGEPTEDVYAQMVAIMQQQAVDAQLALQYQEDAKGYRDEAQGIKDNVVGIAEDFDTNATSKTTNFNDNATTKTTAFNNNETSKTSAFNENVTSKTNIFNDNATSKTNEVNAIKDNVVGIQEDINITAGEVLENSQKAKTSEDNAKDSEDNAKISEDNAEDSKDTASQALADLLAMLGTDIATLIGGKIPLIQIPAVAIHEIIQITNESELITLTNVQKYDIACLITGTGNNKKISISYQLLDDDNTIRSNWVEVGTGYATQSGHSTTSDEATNATMINGHRIVTMTQAQYDIAVKDADTIYLVG